MSLDSRSDKPDQPTRRRARSVLLAVTLASLALVTLVGPVVSSGLSLRNDLRSVMLTLENDPGALMRRDERQALLGDLQSIESHLVRLNRGLSPMFVATSRLSWIPRVGDTLVALPHMLAMAHDLSVAAGTLVRSLDAFDGLMASSLSGEVPVESATAKLLEALELAQPQIRVANERLDAAKAARERFAHAELLPSLASMSRRLDALLPFVSGGSRILQLAPDLMGVSEPRTYLLVAQNSDELRATGGFVSGIGTVTLAAGEIVDLEFQDSYAVEDWSKPHPDPPSALRKYMLADLWTTRDANWWPDFPTSARAIQELYALNQGLRADGVISVDMKALELMVAALEPIVLEERNQTITADNVRESIYEFWAPPPVEGPLPTDWREWSPEVKEWWAQRKDFMPMLTAAILGRVQDFSSLDVGALAGALKQGLDEKHILLYFDDLTVQSVLEENGWDGAVSASASDYLMIVDSNVGFNKADAGVVRRISYKVDLRQADGPIAEVTINYRHTSNVSLATCDKQAQYEPSYRALIDKCYWDYVRVYTPSGSTLLAVEGCDEYGAAGQEAGKNVFTAYFVLAPGESREIQFRYALPEDILSGLGPDGSRYQLLVQKQPGTLAVPLTARIGLPSGVEVQECAPEPSALSKDVAEFEVRLRLDRFFDLEFGPAP